MVSFDVKSLFTCVPVNDVLEFLNIELNKHVLSLTNNVILELIKLCVVNTCFIFNGQFYRQKFGMQMGNCLSPVLSNIYMEFFESRIANAIITDDIFWVRYVDDIFAILKAYMNLDRILNALNDLIPSIKFTVEKEDGGLLSFLDVTVIRSVMTSNYKFKVYRKATNNNLIINKFSAHKADTKLSALRSMFLRALNICSPEFITEEFKFIYNVGLENNFELKDIDYSLALARKTFYRHKEERNINYNFLSLPYHPNLESIVHPLKLLGFCSTFSYPNNIGKHLICNRPEDNEGIVYKIPCKCKEFYIGQSGKSLEKRILNHKYNIRTNNTSNAICVHNNICNFPVDWLQSQILFKCKDFVKRNIIEAACFYRSKDKNFNISDGLYKLDPFILHTIRRQYKLDNLFN